MIAGRLAGLLRRPTGTDGLRPGSLLSVRVLQAALWLLVVMGPIAAGVLALQVSALRNRVEAVSQQAVVDLPSESAGAEAFAELFVAAFLSAGEDSSQTLAPFLDARSLEGMEEGSWSASRTVSLGAREIGPGYFAVTVAAQVLARDPDSEQPTWVPAGTGFYTVGVVETDSGWAATGLPALVAAPSTGSPPELSVGRLDGLDGAPGLEETVTRFLAAYLAGEGELARYTAPGSHLTPIHPPQFVAVEVVEAGSVPTADGARQVVVRVRATDEESRSQVLEYALVVAERDGRWEVVELLPAPPLDAATDN